MKLFLVTIAISFMFFGCKQELNKVKFDGFTFQTNSQISNEKPEVLIEGAELKFSLKKMNVNLSSSYYSNNLYEYDLEIASPDDTARLQNLKENNIPYVVAERKSDVDLDYHRAYNVFFDTIDGMPVKILKPRIPYSHSYKVFVAEIPKTYKKNIGYKSLTIEFQHVKTESDVLVFEEFYKGMKYQK